MKDDAREARLLAHARARETMSTREKSTALLFVVIQRARRNKVDERQRFSGAARDARARRGEDRRGAVLGAAFPPIGLRIVAPRRASIRPRAPS